MGQCHNTDTEEPQEIASVGRGQMARYPLVIRNRLRLNQWDGEALGEGQAQLGVCWNGTPVAEERNMVLALAQGSIPAKRRGVVFAAARRVLFEPFGAPWASGGSQLGARRAGHRVRKSHSSWLKRRRSALTPPGPSGVVVVVVMFGS